MTGAMVAVFRVDAYSALDRAVVASVDVRAEDVSGARAAATAALMLSDFDSRSVELIAARVAEAGQVPDLSSI